MQTATGIRSPLAACSARACESASEGRVPFRCGLEPVHPEVVFTARILGDHEGKRDE